MLSTTPESELDANFASLSPPPVGYPLRPAGLDQRNDLIVPVQAKRRKLRRVSDEVVQLLQPKVQPKEENPIARDALQFLAEGRTSARILSQQKQRTRNLQQKLCAFKTKSGLKDTLLHSVRLNDNDVDIALLHARNASTGESERLVVKENYDVEELKDEVLDESPLSLLPEEGSERIHLMVEHAKNRAMLQLTAWEAVVHETVPSLQRVLLAAMRVDRMHSQHALSSTIEEQENFLEAALLSLTQSQLRQLLQRLKAGTPRRPNSLGYLRLHVRLALRRPHGIVTPSQLCNMRESHVRRMLLQRSVHVSRRRELHQYAAMQLQLEGRLCPRTLLSDAQHGEFRGPPPSDLYDVPALAIVLNSTTGRVAAAVQRCAEADRDVPPSVDTFESDDPLEALFLDELRRAICLLLHATPEGLSLYEIFECLRHTKRLTRRVLLEDVRAVATTLVQDNELRQHTNEDLDMDIFTLANHEHARRERHENLRAVSEAVSELRGQPVPPRERRVRPRHLHPMHHGVAAGPSSLRLQ
ncbi:MAG: hypothetical protein MHM6MM_002641 [Cercozoa sp. M6MM]